MSKVSREEIVARLSNAFARASNGRAKSTALDDDTRIMEDIGLSSLDLLELRFEIEELCGAPISNDEAARLRTVGDVIKLIQKAHFRACS
ncbi:MAG TPA: phosphopantetheine-binding protein [Pirellulales bacterium]|jgi:acyl carrier protein